ncbi:hypothetical protein [Geobacter sp. AOG2]|uniref:Nmad2 family putative nucleotide modification protein n=1 Tax=Geobacter sp. AOG2 TaxID=1566347 RepID=UPI001CC7B7BB|nr:hypothetical protein [Geobacter sp. AOG2]GFE59580.1 hypothetical protein AOG2_01680 [Geobacter sp. AOG2]
MMNYLYIYVVDRDFGFAPNPFHGYCTLATCKARIRKSAQLGDWIVGVGGDRLNAVGRCIYLMKVTEILSFNDYWFDSRFQRKKPQRNGSLVMMVGDNIYHKEEGDESWKQEDSQHSNPDGSLNHDNVRIDTFSDNVLISDFFYYFGEDAPTVKLELIEYQNGRNYQKMQLSDNNIVAFIDDIEQRYSKDRNRVIAFPFNFLKAAKRVDQSTSKII